MPRPPPSRRTGSGGASSMHRECSGNTARPVVTGSSAFADDDIMWYANVIEKRSRDRGTAIKVTDNRWMTLAFPLVHPGEYIGRPALGGANAWSGLAVGLRAVLSVPACW